MEILLNKAHSPKMEVSVPFLREGSASTLYLLGVGMDPVSILEGVVGRDDGGTLGGSEGGTESGGFSAPMRAFTLGTVEQNIR